MKLKKIRLKQSEKNSLCVWKDNAWITLRAVLDTVPDNGTKERNMLERVSDDLIGFLKNMDILQPELEKLIRIAKEKKAEITLEGEEIIPFQPLFYRDFMLCERHLINSSREYTKRRMPQVMPFINIYEAIMRKPFPSFRPKKLWYDNPIYYKGNPLSFFSDSESIKFPQYANVKDYELELGIIISKDILNATEQEAYEAIGAFCVFNDFSVRNVQLDEMRKTGFGPCKAKDFASSISSVVVTADEVLPDLDTLKTRVYINDRKISEGQLNEFYHSVGKAIAYASKGEKVYAGEFMATGTIPNCCGMENGVFLEEGDVIRLEIDGVGSLSNSISRNLL